MEVSIIIPVFNKSDFTRVCLNALKRHLPATVPVEVIVIDNNSSDNTQAVLAEFPWVLAVRNDTNRGFAGANNQGAKVARGRILLLLNNDTEVRSGFLEALLSASSEDNVGVVGGRLLFPNETIQHAGVVVQASRFGPHTFVPYHYLWSDPARRPAAMHRRDFQVVTGACLLTPRKLYEELGGLDEAYWNGYEDVDYCFKVRKRGLRVCYEPLAEVLHFESQSGPERFSRVAHNVELLSERWRGFPKVDHNRHYLNAGAVRRWGRLPNQLACMSIRAPRTTVFVHGPPPVDVERLRKSILSTTAPVDRVVWNVAAPVPAFKGVAVQKSDGDLIEAVRAEMDVRGDRYLMFLDARADLGEDWLEELIESVEFGPDVIAATVAPELRPGRDVTSLAADARCTLVSLRHIPQDVTLDRFDTLDGAVADLLLRMLSYEFATRVPQVNVASLPALLPDGLFELRHGATVASFLRDDAEYVERRLAQRDRTRGGSSPASIIMLSWNAPEFTKIALASIREHTKMPYELIIVDNGSGPETTQWLREQTGITVIYNKTNMGFAHGCNQGIAAATGDYVVLLNNDVVVTEGWLERLTEAVARDPATGVSAPRSNEIAGSQRLTDASYGDLTEMHAMADRRARDFARSGYFTDRAIGFCLCIDRKVIEQIGGIDDTFLTGNFEDDDFCMRVRAAGYRIFVCDDVFIHHFGSVSFKTNQVNYMETMQRNWKRFASKWDYPQAYPANGYEPASAIAGGFNRSKHYVPLPLPAAESTALQKKGLAFMGVVSGENDWGVIAAVVRRYLSVFGVEDDVVFAIACTGPLGAEQIGARLENMLVRLKLDPERCADVHISDEEDLAAWNKAIDGAARVEIPGHEGPRLGDVPVLQARSRNDLKRAYEAAGAD